MSAQVGTGLRKGSGRGRQVPTQDSAALAHCGHEDVITGTVEDLIEHNSTFMVFDTPVWFVDKLEVYLPGNRTASKLDAMTVIDDALSPAA